MATLVTDFVNQHDPREWRKAWTALKNLIKSPESTDQVFVIMKALAGNTHAKQFQRFFKSEGGNRILVERLNILDKLKDHDYLASLPSKSLGRAYLDFMQAQDLSADGLVESSQVAYTELKSKDLRLYFDRSRDVHDLWHVLTGYGRDNFGEACLVAYSYAQTKSLGFAAIALMGGYDFTKKMPGNKIWSTLWQSYRDGRKSDWLMGVVYEDMLEMDLDEARKMLNIPRPVKYINSPDVIAGLTAHN